VLSRLCFASAVCEVASINRNAFTIIASLSCVLASSHSAFAVVPAAPTGLTASASSYGQINLSWSAVSGATSYKVKRALTTGGPYSTVNGGLTLTSYADTGLGDGIAYYYVVSASNSSGESPNSVEVSTTTNTVSSPRNLTVTPGEKQTLLTWTPVGGKGYNLYRSTSAAGTYSKINGTALVTPNGYLDPNLVNGTAYYYKVAFVNTSGVESSQSSPVSASPLAQDANWTVALPSGYSAPAPTISANTASFSKSSGADLMISAGAAGSVTSAVTATAQNSSSGAYTFTWTGTSWPTLYVVTRQQLQAYSANVNAGTGSATVSNTGGTTIVSASYPVTGSALNGLPQTVSTSDTSDLSHVIFSRLTSFHCAGALTAPGSTSGTTTGWNEMLHNSNLIQTAYTAQWFQSHFATPGSIVLTFTAAPSDVTSSVSLSASTSKGYAIGTATVSDQYQGS